MLSPSAKKEWWVPIEEAFAGISLKSLKITCPECGKNGIVTTRWIKGPTLKPIYILHTSKSKVVKVCELNKEQSKIVRGEVSILEYDIKKFLESRRSFVLFSGGKDSLATLIYLNSITNKINNHITAIYVDTTAGIPENTEFVKKICEYLSINLEIVRPKIDYFTLAKEWGIPSFNCRWCCRELKIKPIEEFLQNIKEPKVVFDGLGQQNLI